LGRRFTYSCTSRIKRFAAWKKAFAFQDLLNEPATPTQALAFGSLLHAALERVYRDIAAEKITGRFPLDRLVAAFTDARPSSGLSGEVVFQEGVSLLRDYTRRQGTVDHSSILAVEQEFWLSIGGFRILGYIDRVDRIDDETVMVFGRLVFIQDDGVDPAAFFLPDELEELLGTEGGRSDIEDNVPTPEHASEAKWGTARGQVWVIPNKEQPHREHRLMCGDSTNQALRSRRAYATKQQPIACSDRQTLVGSNGAPIPIEITGAAERFVDAGCGSAEAIRRARVDVARLRERNMTTRGALFLAIGPYPGMRP